MRTSRKTERTSVREISPKITLVELTYPKAWTGASLSVPLFSLGLSLGTVQLRETYGEEFCFFAGLLVPPPPPPPDIGR